MCIVAQVWFTVECQGGLLQSNRYNMLVHCICIILQLSALDHIGLHWNAHSTHSVHCIWIILVQQQQVGYG